MDFSAGIVFRHSAFTFDGDIVTISEMKVKTYLLRLDERDYEDIKRAAELRGMNVPSYLRSIIKRENRKVLFEQKTRPRR